MPELKSVPGFAATSLEFEGTARCVYRAGTGPAVIVMSEIPGITPQVAGFAQKVVEAGHTVFMPLLFGESMRPPERGYALRVIAKSCISKEFRVLAANESSPIVDWLRALVRTILNRTRSVNSPPEPITHGGRNEIGGILLHEMPGARDGDQREVLLDQVPGATESTRQ